MCCETKDLNLVKAWIFGDKIWDNTFQDATIHTIFKRLSTSPEDDRYYQLEPRPVKYAYKHIMEGAAIRRLFVDLCCLDPHGQLVSPWADEDIPYDFLLKLANELAKRPVSAKAMHPSDYCVNDEG